MSETFDDDDSGGRDQRVDRRPRAETEAERADRNLAELLQELRVAAIGVQVLFGFLLSLPFTDRFAHMSDIQRALYLISLTASAVATALLVAPVAYHRVVFRQHLKTRLVKSANVMALLGLVTVGLAINTAIWLIVSVAYHGAIVAVFAAGVPLLYLTLWLIIPLSGRQRARTQSDAEHG